MLRVLAFARYRDLLGFHSLELPVVAHVGELLRDDRFAALPKDALIAVNQTFADPTTPLKAGDEVALLPPVSGG